MRDREHFPFGQLDFLYMPSRDVAGDVEYFTSLLGARLEFAIEAFGTRVAMVRLSDQPPSLLFATANGRCKQDMASVAGSIEEVRPAWGRAVD